MPVSDHFRQNFTTHNRILYCHGWIIVLHSGNVPRVDNHVRLWKTAKAAMRPMGIREMKNVHVKKHSRTPGSLYI